MSEYVWVDLEFSVLTSSVVLKLAQPCSRARVESIYVRGLETFIEEEGGDCRSKLKKCRQFWNTGKVFFSFSLNYL